LNNDEARSDKAKKKHGVAVSGHDTTGVLVLVLIVAAGVGSTTPVAGAAEGETGKGLSVPVVVINGVTHRHCFYKR